MEKEFKMKVSEAFKSHSLMKNRDYHTINELLYVLGQDPRFNGEDFNVSIRTLNNSWYSIPCLDAFVDIKTRGIWFKDEDLEFEIEDWDDKKYNCITIYER